MINWLKNKVKENAEHEKLLSLLGQEDFVPVKNTPPKEIKSFAFVIARMLAHSGGYTSVLRLGTELEKHGIKVYYAVVSKYQSTAEAKTNAESNLAGYKGEIISFSELEAKNTDVVAATHWSTAYAIKPLKAYKMYFVQDYEPYFTQYGEQYLLARKTYELGYHMVSLGGWNAYMIGRECPNKPKVDVIDFPFEPKEYEISQRDYSCLKTKQTYKLAVFIKSDQKRMPNIVNAMVGKLAEEFERNGKRLDVYFYGIDKKFKVSCGVNLGYLNKQQLRQLYESSDFGMCASMTNISLVPYEMIASGLPVIEFKDGTFPFFFPEESGILTGFSYMELYSALDELINDPVKIKEKISLAQEYMRKLSWENTGKEFVDILLAGK